MKMLDNLNVNEAQRCAITHGEGAMLVLAGPGSGKTLVITQRIKYLVEELKIKPEDILVITFTKAAAREMQERFLKIMGQGSCPVNFGTFHATFFNILKRTYKFTGENIIKESDKYRLISQIMEEMPPELLADDEGKDESRDERKAYDNDSGSELIQEILSEISTIKNNGITPQEFVSEAVPQAQLEYICAAYKREMNSQKLVDFDDMVLLCRDLLLSRPDVLEMWQERFKYILIDEFQDICPLQYEVVRLLAKPQDNLFIVGDDDQSIYGFRGSKPEIMLNFQKDYPEAKRVLLNVNYRSRRDIVEAAGRLISHNKVRFEKEVETNNQNVDGVRLYAFASKQKQAENIALLIKQYMEGEGARYSDIAILYRTSSHMLHTLPRLASEGIPFVVNEKPKNIYQSPVARDIVSYLRYAQRRDSVSDFMRIMNSPVRYIKRSYVPSKPFGMNELMRNCGNEDYVLQNVVQMYEHLDFIKGLDPFAAVNFIRKGVGYDAHIVKQCANKGQDSSEKISQLDELQQLAKGFDTIEEWLCHIESYDSMLQDASKKGREAKDDDAVSIVTMHA